MKKTVHAILDKVLALLGFSSALLASQSCRDEYGCPYADYKLNVKVTDTGNNPIRGIQVVYLPDGENSWWRDTLYTDGSGKAEKILGQRGFYDLKAEFKAEDVDGLLNGSYKGKTVSGSDIRIVQTKEGDRKWYGGEFEISTEIQLEKED